MPEIHELPEKDEEMVLADKLLEMKDHVTLISNLALMKKR